VPVAALAISTEVAACRTSYRCLFSYRYCGHGEEGIHCWSPLSYLVPDDFVPKKDKNVENAHAKDNDMIDMIEDI